MAGIEDYISQVENLTDEDIRMLGQVAELLNTQYLNKTNKAGRSKRFGLDS